MSIIKSQSQIIPSNKQSARSALRGRTGYSSMLNLAGRTRINSRRGPVTPPITALNNKTFNQAAQLITRHNAFIESSIKNQQYQNKLLTDIIKNIQNNNNLESGGVIGRNGALGASLGAGLGAGLGLAALTGDSNSRSNDNNSNNQTPTPESAPPPSIQAPIPNPGAGRPGAGPPGLGAGPPGAVSNPPVKKGLAAAKMALRGLGPLATIFGAYSLMNDLDDIEDKHNKGEITEEQYKKEYASAIGGFLGGSAGSMALASVGAILGAPIAGGGAIVGGVVGGVAGFFAGEAIGKYLGETISAQLIGGQKPAPPQPRESFTEDDQNKLKETLKDEKIRDNLSPAHLHKLTQLSIVNLRGGGGAAYRARMLGKDAAPTAPAPAPTAPAGGSPVPPTSLHGFTDGIGGGNSTGARNAPPAGGGVRETQHSNPSPPNIREISEYIVSTAKAKGVDPNLALGIASREGLKNSTIRSPTFGNIDNKGYSYGPYQLYSGSKDPNVIAPGGMAADFMNKYGDRPRASNWKQQVDFSLDIMKRRGPHNISTTWYAIGNAGGVNNISIMGANFAMQQSIAIGGIDAMMASATAPNGGNLNAASANIKFMIDNARSQLTANVSRSSMPQQIQGSASQPVSVSNMGERSLQEILEELVV